VSASRNRAIALQSAKNPQGSSKNDSISGVLSLNSKIRKSMTCCANRQWVIQTISNS
jgi:hypothetical protein